MTDRVCALTELPVAMCAHCRGIDEVLQQRSLFPLDADGPPVLATFESICNYCRDDIVTGDLIRHTSAGWTHTECAE